MIKDKKDKELFDMDFSEIEARVVAAMSEEDFRKQHLQDWSGLESPTGRNALDQIRETIQKRFPMMVTSR